MGVDVPSSKASPSRSGAAYLEDKDMGKTSNVGNSWGENPLVVLGRLERIIDGVTAALRFGPFLQKLKAARFENRLYLVANASGRRVVGRPSEQRGGRVKRFPFASLPGDVVNRRVHDPQFFRLHPS